jgi:hypothetical protein
LESHNEPQTPLLLTGETLLEETLTGELADPAKYDAGIVRLLRKHLTGASIRSRAGQELAEDLVTLAQQRVIEARPK